MASSLDSNKIPREIAVVACDKEFEQDGNCHLRGKKLSDIPKAFLFVMAHETMHSFNLEHGNLDKDNHLMQELEHFIPSRENDPSFPDNIKFNLKESDKKKLKHYPDIHVRPGGSVYPSTQRDDLSIAASGPVKLIINRRRPGAPPVGCLVRLNLQVTNTGHDEIEIPSSINASSIRFWGEVVPKFGSKLCRRFKKILYTTNPGTLVRLKKDEKHYFSLTLFHGTSGPLFPEPGKIPNIGSVSNK